MIEVQGNKESSYLSYNTSTLNTARFHGNHFTLSDTNTERERERERETETETETERQTETETDRQTDPDTDREGGELPCLNAQ